MSKKIPHQGEIWLVDFNRKKEAENSKIRPVIILSNNWQNQYSKYVVVAPLTSETNKLKNTAAYEVLVKPNKENGLDRKSQILLHRIQAIDKELRLVDKLGQVNEDTWSLVWKSLWVVFTGTQV